MENLRIAPAEVQRAAHKQYRPWLQNPRHSSVQFKPIGELWSARVTQECRALALAEGAKYHWVWIGTHAEYDQILRRR
ncbi:hypothetical protein LBMAG56_24670 [Verrucomicrobiota bacterium]|nr:hypothetical protein LBMAG56_24670 [Verrucomicrobiota bacterium]